MLIDLLTPYLQISGRLLVSRGGINSNFGGATFYSSSSIREADQIQTNSTTDIAGNPLDCLSNIMDISMENAFQPGVFTSLFGHAVPKSSTRNNEMVDLEPFVIPLDLFLHSIYIDENENLQRKEGFALFVSAYPRDGKKFLYSLRNFTCSSFNASDVIDFLSSGKMPFPEKAKKGAQPCIRFNFKCGFANCQAQKQWILQNVQKRQQNIDPPTIFTEENASCSISSSFPYSSSFSSPSSASSSSAYDNHIPSDAIGAINLSSYDVQFQQCIIGLQTHHNHINEDGNSQHRTMLAYDPFEPKKTYRNNSVFIEPEKVKVRCNFNLLPNEKRPDSHLLRSPIEKVANCGSGQPTANYVAHLHSTLHQHGEEVFSSSTLNYSLGQAKCKLAHTNRTHYCIYKL